MRGACIRCFAGQSLCLFLHIQRIFLRLQVSIPVTVFLVSLWIFRFFIFYFYMLFTIFQSSSNYSDYFNYSLFFLYFLFYF
jgi:hypothetical protein